MLHSFPDRVEERDHCAWGESFCQWRQKNGEYHQDSHSNRDDLLKPQHFEPWTDQAEKRTHQTVGNYPAQAPEYTSPNLLQEWFSPEGQAECNWTAHACTVKTAEKAKEESGKKYHHLLYCLQVPKVPKMPGVPKIMDSQLLLQVT